MARLKENQLLMLSTLIYLQGVADSNGKTLGRVVDNLLYKGGLAKSRNINRMGEINEYPCRMTRAEWIKLLTQIKEDRELNTLTIREGIIGAKGICVASFVSKENDVTVVIRGTQHDYQWRDNGQGAYLSDTEQQKQYLEYIKELPYDALTVTGHSKGGNIASYLAILSDQVDSCVSFDGQGFSKEFIEKHAEKVGRNCDKITAIEAAADIVGPLLISVAGERRYIQTEKQPDFLSNHCPHIMLNDDGNLRETTEQSLQSKLINKFTVHFISTAKEPQRSYTIDGVMGFFMKEPGLVGNTQKIKAVGIMASKVPGFIFSELRGTHLGIDHLKKSQTLANGGVNGKEQETRENKLDQQAQVFRIKRPPTKYLNDLRIGLQEKLEKIKQPQSHKKKEVHKIAKVKEEQDCQSR